MPPGTTPWLTSLYSGDFDGSPSNTSRKRVRKRARAGSSSGNSRAGKQPHVLDRVERALRVDVERLDRFDVVAEQVDPVGQRGAHREEVDQSAAQAELAGRDDLRDVRVAGEAELRAQRVGVERLAGGEEERVRGEIRQRRQPIERRLRSDEHDVALLPRDTVERREPRGDQVLMRREMIVGKRFPIGKLRDDERRREPRDLVGKPLQGERVGADDRQHAAFALRRDRELRERQRVGAGGEGAAAQPCVPLRAAPARARAASREVTRAKLQEARRNRESARSIAAAAPTDGCGRRHRVMACWVRGELYAWDNCSMPEHSTARPRVSPYLLLTLTPFFWACNWIVGRGLAHDIPPLRDDVLSLAVRARHPRTVRAPARRARLAIVRRHWRVLRAAGRDRHRHAQRARVSRPQLHDGDQRRHPELVHPHHDRRDELAVPARAAVEHRGSPASSCRSPACWRSSRRARCRARSLSPQRRRPVRHPVDGDVVDLHDLPALPSAGARHDRVPVRHRLHRRARRAAVLPGRDRVRPDDAVDARRASRRLSQSRCSRRCSLTSSGTGVSRRSARLSPACSST